MVKWEAVKRVTVTEQIMEQIALLITEGRLQAGDKLPNERDLAVQLGVTRGRVREALRALSLVGLIRIKAGEGSFVNEQQVPVPQDTILWLFHHEIHNLSEVYAARKLIEPEVYTTSAEHLSEPDLQQLQSLLDRLEAMRSSRSVDAAGLLAVLDEFDVYVGERCGNHIFSKLMQTIVHLRRETSLKVLQVPGAIDSSVHGRKAILGALRTRDARQVRSAVEQFFRSSQTFYETMLND
ncbi:FadR/GntR family transcriptional regulator [Paenibacillus sp. y28]|uniref:FadR/GntR family transcriptional regulator n=1 Tax=Paenibacillus sp. y28 TaxID=3129110 RepID=UPI003017C815